MTMQAMPAAETLAESVARRVRGLMGEQRISGVALARRMSMTQAALSRRTTGAVSFSLDEVEQLAEILDASEAYILGFTAVRARRDSNPKPSELVPRRLTAVVPPAAQLATVLPFCRPERPVERRRSA